MKTRSSQSPSRLAAARTRSAQGIRRWMVAGILTALVLAVAAGAMLQAPQPAAAQTPLKILVNNSGHPAESLGSSALDADIPRQAQQFTTGSDAAGYTLEKIFIGFKFIADPSTAGSELTLTLNEESSGSPGTALCTLRDPSIFNRSGGLHSYSTPNMGMDQCPALRASTTYFAVIERANLDTSTIELLTTSIYGGDSHNAEGWSIGNGAHRYVSANTPPWTHSSGSENILIRVQGVAIPLPPRVTGFDLHRDNNNPQGIWGNDKTIWVSQSETAPKLFAYNRSDGSRDSSKDFTTPERSRQRVAHRPLFGRHDDVRCGPGRQQGLRLHSVHQGARLHQGHHPGNGQCQRHRCLVRCQHHLGCQRRLRRWQQDLRL